MAKTSTIEKNERRAKMARSQANRRKKLKAIVMNKELPLEDRFAATVKLSEMPRNGARARYRKRCKLSGRPRGVYAKLMLSRIAIRDLASIGLIPGMIKSSW